ADRYCFEMYQIPYNELKDKDKKQEIDSRVARVIAVFSIFLWCSASSSAILSILSAAPGIIWSYP
ncbi:MAG: hypothetical protein LWX54_17655, partial [Deltaproteobacteria bacterium]|nr:hypothetical protein [Deltaproteobacteria bacterium]